MPENYGKNNILYASWKIRCIVIFFIAEMLLHQTAEKRQAWKSNPFHGKQKEIVEEILNGVKLVYQCQLNHDGCR